MNDIEKRTITKVMKRLVPLLILCYFVAYLDRVNVGFAKLEMDTSLGLSEAAFGLGAGIFFVAYFLLEIPSNLALDKFGARIWIARIMFSWGLISGLFAFITPIAQFTGLANETVFYSLRFLLGLAEAGFFPGIIFFLTLWFPARYRAQVVAMFMTAIPFSSIIGAPLSGVLLSVTGFGLAGWQWLFILEAVPSILVAGCVIAWLTDRPILAKWLADDERQWLQSKLDAEMQAKVSAEHVSVVRALSDPRVLGCAVVYFCLNAASYGVVFFLPSIVKGFGVTNFQTGLLTALPFICGAIGMVLFGRFSDRSLRRKQHVALVMMITAVGVGGAGLVSAPVLVLGLLCLGQIGASSMPPLFWPIPNTFLSGTAAAAGIATINSIGNLSGFLGPYMMGYVKQLTGSFSTGLVILGLTSMVGAVVVTLLRVDTLRETRTMLEPGAPLVRDSLA